ncbi:hypothetical protein AHAT_18920 [Agarivorans sp. Toyoura001]|uniref:hypothetical protein n=1 Tax=Agarivorans sp. Toyoura001 TaxID=2283141 RepID=UPI0010D208BA|nr:hypothetical protein [Agarivorans sp. Toyoura001]GDY26002.1 hypothetical protein AHAT_18920 [Agarivorans sp. Toyoura001]
MSSQAGPENPTAWLHLLTNTPGFLWGLMLGTFTGYLGNWAWEKFKPKKKHGHLLTEADNTGTTFSGRMTEENREQVIKTLRATVPPSGTVPPKVVETTRSGTKAPTQRGRSSS